MPQDHQRTIHMFEGPRILTLYPVNCIHMGTKLIRHGGSLVVLKGAHGLERTR